MLLALQPSVRAEHYTLSTPNSTLVLTADAGEPLYFRYYGATASLDEVFASYRSIKYEAFRSYGTRCDKPHAVLVKHADGDNATSLVVESAEQNEDNLTRCLTFTLRDVAHPFKVKVHYAAYKDCDVVKTWAEYVNCGKKAVSLQKYMSSVLPVVSQECVLLHMNGDHANECHENVEPLGEGIKVLSTQDGSRPAAQNQAAFMLGTDGRLDETCGNVIAGTLLWTGNFQMEFINTRIDKEPVLVMAGINPTGSDYTLEGGATFIAPEMVYTYSTKGKGQASRNLHYWARHHQILDGTKSREVLLNSWEGVHMDIKQDEMNAMMSDFKQMGGELFVMDDGWFGSEKHKRTDPTKGLGDWDVDATKLPGGIDVLVEYAKSQDMKFGIWIEPEMVNTKSELYEKHPDWVLRHEAFEPSYGRGNTQLLLDLTNHKVQDFVFGVVDNLISNHPELYYIKWDHNMSMHNASSPYLPKRLQSNLQVEYQKGLKSILDRVRAKHPHFVIQLCSAGGFRLNYGFMPYFQEVWPSDHTDAMQRLYIQWGVLNFYPSNILAAHVCSDHNKYTQRVTPIKFRFDVASMCRLGMEMVPAHLTEAQLAYAKRAIAEYKRLRDVIQQGDLYKLVSPYEGNRDHAALMYVNGDRSKSAVFLYRTIFTRHMADKVFKMQGLDPNRNYLIREVCPETEGQPVKLDGKVVSGRFLMEEGVVLRELNQGYSKTRPVNEIRDINDYRSVVLELITQ